MNENTSNYLDSIIENKMGVAQLKVVFFDIEKYSKRRNYTQSKVINIFTFLLKEAINEISREKKVNEYAQLNNINFLRDVIKLPTGDGAAVILPFEGQSICDIHLLFALSMLKLVLDNNKDNQCDNFLKERWCHCHSNFYLRVGISEGTGIIYRDVNNNYNCAGDVINMAARVMNLVDGNQIALSSEAYNEITGMTTDTSILNRFRDYDDVEIKHDIKVPIYQYIGNEEFLNPEPPSNLSFFKETKSHLNELRTSLISMLSSTDEAEKLDKRQIIRLLERMKSLTSAFEQTKNRTKPYRPHKKNRRVIIKKK